MPLLPAGTSMPITVTLLDGGLGTSLESILGQDISDHPLWSANAAISHREALHNVHCAFLRAGSRIIETATYQASFPTLSRAGFDEDASRKIMLSAVDLAVEASATSPRDVKIALSLGPFGATLRPTQEFLGFYPPPYGPKRYDAGGDNHQDFNSPEDEARTIDALAHFHLERLLVFSDTIATWDAIHFLAFETVLLAREVTAIRRAVGMLQQHLSKQGRAFDKTWWISFVFPGGASTPTLPLVHAAFAEPSSDDLPVPPGIGINCTSIDDLLPLALDLTSAASTLIPPTSFSDHFLVLYPNGGKYDTTLQTWLPEPPDADALWADTFIHILSELSTTWDQFIVGGCCRTSASFIKCLSDRVNSFTFS